MKRKLLFTITAIGISLLLSPLPTRAQSADVPKYEVGADFSSFTLSSGKTEPGLGGRFTYNINKHVALEAAGYFFPRTCEFCSSDDAGRIAEGLFGVKAGKRFQKWGIFGKARPGLVSFSKGAFNLVPTGGGGPFPFRVELNRLTNFALDVGGVLEFYPSHRIVTRFDFGDTMVRFGQRTTGFQLITDPITGVFTLGAPITSPAITRHNLQFTAGVGFRF
jgi:hypothetical protein